MTKPLPPGHGPGRGHRLVDLRGHVFGYLRPIEIVGRSRSRHVIWKCACNCGAEHHVQSDHLRNGTVLSCGCLSIDRHTTHGDAGVNVAPEYTIWRMMKRRCENPSDKYYYRYGGRGVTVCAEWSEEYSAFLRDMGRRPTPKHSLDRRNNDLSYYKENCRWSTPKEQARNSSAARPVVRSDGVRYGSMAEAAEINGIDRSVISQSCRYGGGAWRYAAPPAAPAERGEG